MLGLQNELCKERSMYSYLHAKHNFEVFGGWKGFKKTCVAFYCDKMLKYNRIVHAPTTYLPLSE